MAEMEKVEYEFPDEKEEKEQAKPEAEQKELPLEAKDDAEIEVVDDTPPQDRGRKPLDTPPEVPTDDELAQYSDNVRQRIEKFTKGYHDERRRAEAALREKEEALRLAQAIVEENKRLKGSLNKGQEALLNQAKFAVGLELERPRRSTRKPTTPATPML